MSSKRKRYGIELPELTHAQKEEIWFEMKQPQFDGEPLSPGTFAYFERVE